MASKIIDFIEGRAVLEEVESKYNGTLTVVRDLLWGTYIRGGGLPQSGGLAEKIWRISLASVKKKKVVSSLIVGLGGGGIAKIIRTQWPEALIVGVDIDEAMVTLGEKYLGLTKTNTEIHIEDASSFINKCIKKKTFDLVCVDTYCGDEFPKKFQSKEFLEKVKKLLSPDGIAIFNRLYGHEDREKAHEFEHKLQKVFGSVERVYPEANIMFVCKA